MYFVLPYCLCLDAMWPIYFNFMLFGFVFFFHCCRCVCLRLNWPEQNKVHWNIYFNVYLFVEFYFQGTELLPAELLEKAEMPKVVFIGFGLAGLLCLLLGNAALFAWFIIRRRSKGVFYSIICIRISFFFFRFSINRFVWTECMCECEHTFRIFALIYRTMQFKY